MIGKLPPSTQLGMQPEHLATLRRCVRAFDFFDVQSMFVRARIEGFNLGFVSLSSFFSEPSGGRSGLPYFPRPSRLGEQNAVGRLDRTNPFRFSVGTEGAWITD